VRAQIATQRGGADVIFNANGLRQGGARMLAVVTLRSGEQGRHYRLSSDRDYEAVRKSQERVAAILDAWERGGKQGLCPVPNEPVRRVPVPFGVINVWVYGMLEWGDLFTARQKWVLVKLRDLLVRDEIRDSAALLACAFNRVSMSNVSCTRWNPVAEKMQHTFGRQALPFVWDFAEVVVTADAPGNWESGYELIADVIDAAQSRRSGQAQLADAAQHPLPDETASVWFTDPPYYDAVPYSYISDFFYVWLRRTVGPLFPTLFSSELTPKSREIVAYIQEGKAKASAYATYEERMATAFAEGVRILRPDGIASVVFAHKTTEGWEALLSGMIGGGWTITGSWPVATEMATRLRARDSATLSTSVHLVCRPRPDDASVGDWANVLHELPPRVGDWMERLQSEGVRGADLVFACIGPALEIFSRYRRVETADGREVRLSEYLAKVWEVVGRGALAQVLGTAEAKARNGAVGAFEEDARLTALFLWSLQSTIDETAEAQSDQYENEDFASDEHDEEGSSHNAPKGYMLIYDVVRRFAQPLGIQLPKWEGRVIDTKKGVVRLLPIAERAKQLFGEDGAQAVAERLELETVLGPTPLQGMLFPEMQAIPEIRGREPRGRSGRMGVDASDPSLVAAREATTLDRVHAAMLLQASGRTNALRALLKSEQERSPDFLRLANALSALYPRGSEEKRLLDAMLLAAPR
jgi:hypothetical protein